MQLDGSIAAARAWLERARSELAVAEGFHASARRMVELAEGHLTEVSGRGDSEGITRAQD